MDVRTALAAVLGIGLGLLCLLSPGTVLTVQTAGRLPQDRSGEYGTEGDGSGTFRRLVQVVGGVLVAGGLYFAWQALAV